MPRLNVFAPAGRLTLAGVCELLGLDHASLTKLMRKDATFPKPCGRIGRKRLLWSEASILEYRRQQVKQARCV